jgi:hypothetical protein
MDQREMEQMMERLLAGTEARMMAMIDAHYERMMASQEQMISKLKADRK